MASVTNMVSIAICKDGRPSFTIVYGESSPQPEKNAAFMLVKEVAHKTGTTLAVVSDRELTRSDPTGNLVVLGTLDSNAFCKSYRQILSPLVKKLGKEGFIIKAVSEKNRLFIFLVGVDYRGVLYAADEFLDCLERKNGSAEVLLEEFADAPVFPIRALGSPGGFGFPHGGLPTSETVALMEESIDLAARSRLNTLSFTVSWPADLTPFVLYEKLPKIYEPSRENDVRKNVNVLKQVVAYAAERGLDTYVTTTEFTYPDTLIQEYAEILGELPPQRQRGYLKHALCPSSPMTWQFYEAKLGEFISRIPEMAGFDLWISESHCDVYACQCPKCRSYTPEKRIIDMVKRTYEISRSDGMRRKMFFRTFLSGFRTSLYTDAWLDYLAKELPKDVIVRHREEPVDFMYGNPPTFLMGRFPRNMEAIDLDAFGEYRGGVLELPSCIPEHMQSRMKGAKKAGIEGVGIGRASGLNEVNLQAFCKLAWNPDRSVEAIWKEWAVDRFGEAAADNIIEIGRLSDDVILKSFYMDSVNINAHFYVFPQSIQRWRYLMVDFSAKFIEDGYERIKPTFGNLKRIVTEKEEAVTECRRMIAILEETRGHLKTEDYESLKTTLELELEVVKTWRWLAEAYFRYEIFEATLSEVDRELMRDQIVATVETCREQIEKLAKVIPSEESFSKNHPIDNASYICDQITERTNYRTALASGYHPLSYYRPRKLHEPGKSMEE